MKIQWKKKKSLKPEHVIDKISSMIVKDGKGNIAFQGFEYHEAIGSLYSMIDFPKSIINELECDSVISQGVSAAAKSEIFNKESVLTHINKIAKNRLETSEKEYSLLTSISISENIPFKSIKIKSCRIVVQKNTYPMKYHSRNGVLKENSKNLELYHEGYKKIIVYCKSKSDQGAASKALDSLDIARAIINLFSNYSSELIGDSFSPINRAVLGQVHSLHNRDGKAIKGIYWFEPNFVRKPPLTHGNPIILKKNFSKFLKNIETTNYKDAIYESLLRYVRALDEKDQNIAVIKAWNALEGLLCPNSENFEKIPSRCSYLFHETQYHKQVLEHIREFRNEYVHASVNNQNAKDICYQIQFYYRELVIFLIRKSIDFKSLEEANSFLDLPADINNLKAITNRIEMAIKFRAPD